MQEKILNSRFMRHKFIVRLLVLFGTSVTLKFLVLPHFSTPTSAIGPFTPIWANILAYVFDAIAQSAITTTIIAAAFLLFVPRDLREGAITTLHPGDIRHALSENLVNADHYWFRGRSGRWFRKNALPRMAAQARHDGKSRGLDALLPNPANPELMRSYAAYRNSIKFRGASKQWTEDMIVQEVLATIVAIYHAAAQNVLLIPRIGLLDAFSLLRADITNNGAVITRENPSDPAIRLSPSTALFGVYREEVIQGIAQGRQLPAPNPAMQGHNLDEMFVSKVLSLAGLSSLAPNSAFVAQILERARNTEDPYE